MSRCTAGIPHNGCCIGSLGTSPSAAADAANTQHFPNAYADGR